MTTQDNIATPKKVEFSFTLPSVNISAIYSKAVTFLSTIFRPVSKNSSESADRTTSRLKSFNFNSIKDKMKFNKRDLKFIIPAVAGIIVLAGIISVVRSLPNAESRPVETTQNVSQNALATINLDRKFEFPLRDETGKEVATFNYVIQSAQLQKQIIVKGQRASAIEGRIFLILNLKITNSEKQTISLNTRDYLRLVVASTPNEQLAPDIHNDPVEVQAISTKYTRVGIAINEEDAKKLVQLKVGEIDAEKQNIDLNFQY